MGRHRALRLLSIAASAFAFFCVLLAWSGTAAAQSYPLQRAQTPNTWQRPNAGCPGGPPATERAFNIYRIRVPPNPANATVTVTATRTAGSGIGIDVYQGAFPGTTAGWECVNSFGGTYSGSGTATFSFSFLNPGGFGDNYFDVVVSGNGASDGGSFTIMASGNVPFSNDCIYGAFTPANQSGIPATGGSFSTVFSPAPGCGAWTMSGIPSWITGFTPNGNGTTTINYTAASNPGASRSASITSNGVSFSVSQHAASVTCSYSLGATSTSVSSAGGAGSFTVNANPNSCGWSATSNATWITGVSPAGGIGDTTVNFNVQANSGPTRSGTITAAGQTFTVNQANGCAVSVTPGSANHGAGSGSGSFNVNTAAGCGWTVAESSTWLALGIGAGTGPGTVSYTVDANSDIARSANITVTNSANGATSPFTVNQSSGCAIALTPGSATPTNAGGASSFNVVTGPNCAWTVSESATWLNGVTPSGTGSGAVNYTVDPNTGVGRSANIQVTATATNASGSFSVTQSDGCTTSLNPVSVNRAATSGSGSFAVTMSSPTCPWTATSNSAFVTGVTPSGTGNGTVNFTVAANAGIARTGTITVNGHTFTINQADGCTASLDPTSATPGAAGGAASFSIQMSAPTCPWTASSATPWLTAITASGAGTSTVNYTVQANGGPSRTGTITAGGQTFTVTQGSGCTVSLPVSSGNVTSAGGSSSFAVTAPAGCGFTATSGAAWLTATVTPTGVNYTAAPSANAARSATITVTSTTTGSNATFTVNQAPGCVLALAPTSTNATAAGGAASFGVTSGSGCTWTAASTDPWLSSIAVTGAGVNYNVAANTGPARNGTVVVTNPQTGGTATFAVAQASGCTVTLPVSTGTATSAGGDGTFAYTPSNAACVVTASSADAWLTNTTATGGNAGYSAAANTGIARTGTVTVTTDTGSTATFTITQGDGCTVTLPAASGTVPLSGGSSTFLVSTGTGCAYTATTTETWLSAVQVTATGVSFTAASNPAIARSATIVVTNTTSASSKTFTVNQDGPVVTPIITKHPEDVTVDEGAPFSLSVTATGGSLVYQWRKDSVDIPGANAATFSVTAAKTSDAGSYDVVVKNPAGSATSNDANVVVRPREDGGVGAPDGGVIDVENGFGVSPSGGACNCDVAGNNIGSNGWFAVIGLGIALFCTRRRRSA